MGKNQIKHFEKYIFSIEHSKSDKYEINSFINSSQTNVLSKLKKNQEEKKNQILTFPRLPVHFNLFGISLAVVLLILLFFLNTQQPQISTLTLLTHDLEEINVFLRNFEENFAFSDNFDINWE